MGPQELHAGMLITILEHRLDRSSSNIGEQLSYPSDGGIILLKTSEIYHTRQLID